MGCGNGGEGDSGLWNQGGYLGDTLTEMACLSGHTATWGASLLQATASAPGETQGPPHATQRRWYSRSFRLFFGGSPTFVFALGGVQLPLPVLQWP